MTTNFASVIPCDTCDGTLKATPGRGLVCSNGCDATTPERADRRARPATPHQRLRERWDVEERPAAIATSTPAAGAWEVFDARWTKRGAAGVRLGRNGQLTIGGALAAMFSGAQRVELRFDRSGKRIGLVPTESDHGVKVYRLNSTSAIRLSLHGLLSHYGLRLPEKVTTIAATVEGDVLVVPVKDLAS